MRLLTIVKRNPFVVPMAVVGAAAMVFISEGSYWQSVATLDDLGEMARARTSIQLLERSLVDAETGQRGYLLTGRKEYLVPYERALRNIDQSFQVLDQHYVKDPKPADVLRRLRAASDTKMSELTVTMRLHDEGKGNATTELMLSGIGKETMDSIRLLTAELLEYESLQVVQGRRSVYQTLLTARIGVAVLSAVLLLALVLYLRKSLALMQHEEDVKQLVQAERDRLEVEVAQRTAQLRELAQHLQTAREDERNRLARNLHDELGALLTSAKLDAARIRSRLADTAPEALERLAHLVGTLNDSIALGRRIIEDLRPSTLGNLGLVPTIEILAREFAERSGIPVVCNIEPVRLSDTAELMVYRLVQEAFTNVTKYAQASHVWVTMGSRAGKVEVAVRDDGVGFSVGARPDSAYGLVGMRYRVEAEGGTLSIVSTPGQGTQLTATLPEKPGPPG
jgi:signal transduction histidine kinase